MIHMARVARRNLSIWKQIGSDVRSVRKWRGLTDIHVAEKLGIDLKRYRRIERGQTESVTLGEIMSLIKLFDCYPEEIIPTGKIV